MKVSLNYEKWTLSKHGKIAVISISKGVRFVVWKVGCMDKLLVFTGNVSVHLTTFIATQNIPNI